MLVPPLQNQDFHHRAETVSEQKIAEAARVMADANRLLDSRKSKDQQQSESVHETDEPEVDPDASRQQGASQQSPQRRAHVPGIPDPIPTLKDAAHQGRTDGGQFLDLHV